LAIVFWDCARAAGNDELGSAAVVDGAGDMDEVDGAEEIDEADELEELDALDDPNKPGGKASWLDGPSTSAVATGFVAITGWGWF